MARAGLFRHRVAAQRRAAGADAWNEQAGAWATIATMDAQVEPLSGSELVEARAMEGRTTHRVTTRYSSLVLTSKDRFRWQDRGTTRVLNIVAGPLEEGATRRVVSYLVQEVA